jgi:type I restriction enzyme S subunit
MIEARVAEYLHLFLTASAGGRGQLDKAAYGAGKPGLNLQQVAEVAVPLPSMREIRALMENTDALLFNPEPRGCHHDISHQSAQRQNILRAAFSGQLVPQDPDDEPASMLLERIRSERAAQEITKPLYKRGKKRR